MPSGYGRGGTAEWQADIVEVLERTEVGARAGLRAALREDLRALAGNGPVPHRIALLRSAELPDGTRTVLEGLLTLPLDEQGIQHLLVDAPAAPVAAVGWRRAVQDAHAVLLVVGYGPLARATRTPQTRLRPELSALRQLLPVVLAAVPAERIALVVVGADSAGIGGRANLAAWAPTAVRRVLGDACVGLTVAVLQPVGAAEAWLEVARLPAGKPLPVGSRAAALWESSGPAELVEKVLRPWAESATDAVAQLADGRFTAGLHAARQGFADLSRRYGWPAEDVGARCIPEQGRPLDSAHARELRDLLVASACAPLTDL
ncbi:hypothetical protein ABZW18_18865 [Streptomyces sp. NPDC004647]|uniref:hypothetical protein n=1 Tax=Streptomyces sp. NPDC004647 TaxID=3154671 RepID=UPI0033BAE77C